MLTSQVGWSVPFSVTPPNSLQQLQKAAETRSAGKDVRETHELSSCGTVRCHVRQSDASRTGNLRSCCKISSLSWYTVGGFPEILTIVVMSQVLLDYEVYFYLSKSE